MKYLPHLAITAGEPAGIGADLCVLLAHQAFPARITVIADSSLLQERALSLHKPLNIVHFKNENNAPHKGDGTLTVLDVPLRALVKTGELSVQNSPYVLEILNIGVDGCLSGHFDALVTAPVHKGIINDAGIAFTGHTEYLADLTKTSNVVMMLTGGGLRVALVSTHCPLHAVSSLITQELLTQTITILHHDLKSKFHIDQPRIYVAGLNPHAGESGHLGHEEINVIQPVLERLRQDGLHLVGPLPADTMFSPENIQAADAFLAMYHDQGLPVLKYASFGTGVNITLGLPIIRTSVDHGTALEIAGTGKAHSGSLFAAIQQAITLAQPT